jgi:hypothetical protein
MPAGVTDSALKTHVYKNINPGLEVGQNGFERGEIGRGEMH